MSDESDTSSVSAADLADQARQNGVDAVGDALVAGDRPASDLLLLLDQVGVPEDHPKRRLIRRASTTREGRNAVQDAAPARMNALTGWTSQHVDATGYQRLRSLLVPPAQQILIKGPKGSGKTVKALDCARLLSDEFDSLKTITNIQGPADRQDDVYFAERISRILELVRDLNGEQVVVLDELSTVATGYSGAGVGGTDVVEVFGRVINAFRKSEGKGSTRLVCIGHENDADIHPMLRRQSDVVLEGKGKVRTGDVDQAAVYESWQDYQGNDELFRLDGLVDASEHSMWPVDTNYFAHLEFDLDNPEVQIQRGRLVEGWEKFQGDEQDGLAAINDDDVERLIEQVRAYELYITVDEDWTYDDIGEVLNLSHETARTRVKDEAERRGDEF
ncbi:hypothetical protein BRD17_08390 [Halobacteriales archaeon SW_7_68_16]|nr:MAG: hypothetical protein BRD17_08390 [Halobacteriales archaeon SW_7_68_16]